MAEQTTLEKIRALLPELTQAELVDLHAELRGLHRSREVSKDAAAMLTLKVGDKVEFDSNRTHRTEVGTIVRKSRTRCKVDVGISSPHIWNVPASMLRKVG